MTPLVEANGLAIEGRLATCDVQAAAGQRIALVGPNGGGKTSLLRALARVEGAQGTVRVDGEDLDHLNEARRRRLVGLLPASRDLAWRIAVRDVIALGSGRLGHDRVEALIAAFELGDLSDRPIISLSTGERSRVLLARVLADRPRLLLLDEPLSNLDPYWVLRTLDILNAEAAGGACVMVALHDLAQLDHFDRLILLDKGNIVADGTPDALTDRLGDIFAVVSTDGRWALRPSADPRSSP